MAILACERKWTINASWISESIHNDALFDFMGSFGERRWNLKNNKKKKKISCTKGIYNGDENPVITEESYKEVVFIYQCGLS